MKKQTVKIKKRQTKRENKKIISNYNSYIETKKGTSGITLIALVITIIVLLILAGVSIATLTGDNGILTQAQRAQTANDKAQAEEEIKLVVAERQLEKKTNSKANLKEFLDKKVENGELDKVTGNEDGSYTVERNGYEGTINKDGKLEGEVIASDKGDDPPPPTTGGLKPGDKATTTEQDNYEDEQGKKATIPEGFTVSEEDHEIDTGLVVEAPDGSEFVWVPVENAIAENEEDGNTKKAMAVIVDEDYRGLLYNFENTTSSVISGCTTTNFTSNSGFREPAVLNGTTVDEIKIDDSAKGITLPELQSEYKKMIESVEKYGGFYVGRYETSYIGGNVASKKGQTSMSAADDNQTWYGMYEKQESYASKVDFNGGNLSKIVGSSMIWDSQYDAMLNWVLTGTDASKVTTDCEKHEITKTGLTPSDVMNKIYDLGNNLYEWTLGVYHSTSRLLRGGRYNNTFPPSFRGTNHPLALASDYGSRLTLYIK